MNRKSFNLNRASFLTLSLLLVFQFFFFLPKIHLNNQTIYSTPLIKNSDSSVEILFAGDIMLAETIEERINVNGYEYPFEPTKTYLDSANYRVGNLECILSTKGNSSRRWEFEAHPDIIESLEYANFNLLNLANNHILDYGGEALNETLETLEEAEIDFVGLHAGESIENSSNRTIRPFIVEIQNQEFAFLSYLHNYVNVWSQTPSFYQPSELSQYLLEKEIKFTKENYPNATIIVQIHWRINPQYNLTSDPIQKAYSKKAINYGADIVLCHGPHVMQEIEEYSVTKADSTHTGIIFYCIGNYVFHDSEKLTHRGFLVKIMFDKNQYKQIHLLPIERQDYQYFPAGKEQIIECNSSLFLNWSQFETFFKNNEKRISSYSDMFPIFILGFCSIYYFTLNQKLKGHLL